MPDKGYIKVHRGLRDNWLWQDAEYLKWWLDLLMLANYKPCTIVINGKMKTIEAGEHHTSEVKLAQRWYIDRKTVKRYLKLLSENDMITVEQNRQFGTTVKIRNYRKYQGLLDDEEDIKEDIKLDNERDIKEDIKTDIKRDIKKKVRREEVNNTGDTPYLLGHTPNGVLTSLEEEARAHTPYKLIQEQYNRICVSYPKIKAIEGERRKSVGARWRTYPDMETFITLFTKAENSAFLKGGNKKNWSADFDWMINATNIVKILEGKYDDKQGGSEHASNWQNTNHAGEKAVLTGFEMATE